MTVSAKERNIWKNGERVLLSELKNTPSFGRILELLAQSGAFANEEDVILGLRNGLVYVDGNDTIRVLGTGVCLTGEIHPDTLAELIHEVNAPGAWREDPVTVLHDPAQERIAQSFRAIQDPVQFNHDIQKPFKGRQKRDQPQLALSRDKRVAEALKEDTKPSES